MSMPRKARVFWPLALVVLLVDCTTKELAVEHLTPPHVPHEVLGSAVRLTLTYNPGMALGIDLPRPLLIALAFGAIVVLLRLYRRLSGRDRALAAALGLLCGGAAGNLYDRVRGTRGVVDFIDIGAGDLRFWTFNVADVGVTLGALLLALLLWRRDQEQLDSPQLPEAEPPNSG
jgi:signal peptidase II